MVSTRARSGARWFQGRWTMMAAVLVAVTGVLQGVNEWFDFRNNLCGVLPCEVGRSGEAAEAERTSDDPGEIPATSTTTHQDRRFSRTYEVRGTPRAVAVTETGVFVATVDDSGSALMARIDPTDGEATGAAETVTLPGEPASLAANGTGVWVVLEDGGTIRYDATALVDGSVELQGAYGRHVAVAATGGGDVWLVAMNGALTDLYRLDSSTEEVQRVGDSLVGVPSAVAATVDVVWIAYDDSVVWLDPATATLGDPVAMGDAPAALAVDPPYVWARSHDSGWVRRVDREGVQTDVEFAGRNPVAPRDLAAREGSVWVVDALNGGLRRISGSNAVEVSADPRVVAAVEPGAEAVAVGADDVWVAVDGGVVRFGRR